MGKLNPSLHPKILRLEEVFLTKSLHENSAYLEEMGLDSAASGKCKTVIARSTQQHYTTD